MYEPILPTGLQQTTTVLHMPLPTQNLLAWEISVTLFHLLAVGSTLFRLVHRWKTKRMWWDDYITIIPFMADIVYIILMWLRFRDGVAGVTSMAAGITKPAFVSSTWFAAAISWTVIWGSRFSLSLSIARIFPEKHLCRRIAFGLAVIVSLVYVGELLIFAFMCKSSSRPWYNIHHRRCLNGRGMPLRGFVGVVASDFIADILLIAAPLTMLWQVKLPTKERRLILALFSCNLFSLLSFTTFVLIWYFVIDLGPDTIIFSSMFGLVQAAINLIICNLLVVAMFVYRIILRNSGNDARAPRSSSLPQLIGDINESSARNADGRSNAYSLSTSMTFTTIYDSLSRISSAPPSSASSCQNPESKPASYIAQEGEMGSSQTTIPPWSFSRTDVLSVSSQS